MPNQTVRASFLPVSSIFLYLPFQTSSFNLLWWFKCVSEYVACTCAWGARTLLVGLVLYKVSLIYKMLKTTGVLMLSFSLSPVDWQNCMVNESLKSKCFSIPLPLICILVLCTTYHGYMNLYWVSELQQHFYIQNRIRFIENIVIFLHRLSSICNNVMAPERTIS